MKTKTRSLRLVGYLSLAILLVAGGAISRADDGAESRISVTSQGQGIERGGLGNRSASNGSVSNDEFDALVKEGGRKNSTRSQGQQKLSGAESRTPNIDFWVFDADVELFSDFDRDGYFYGIDLLFDVDTVYEVADVYAVIYLSLELGPWNEYAVTDDFTIFGASGDDEYVVVSELISGYPTGDYDILIEIFDVFDGSFVASFGPEDTSELSLLPIEDAGRDAPVETVIVVNSGGGGGSLGWWTLLALIALTGATSRARVSRRNPSI